MNATCPQCHLVVDAAAQSAAAQQTCPQCGYDLRLSFLAVARGAVEPSPAPLLKGADKWKPKTVLPAIPTLSAVAEVSTDTGPIELDDADVFDFDIAEEAALDAKLAAISAKIAPLQTGRPESPVLDQAPPQALPPSLAQTEEEMRSDALGAQETRADALGAQEMPAAALGAADTHAPTPQEEGSEPASLVEEAGGEQAGEPLARSQEKLSEGSGAGARRARYAPRGRRMLATGLDAIPPAATLALALFAVSPKLEAARVPWLPIRGQDAADFWWTLGMPLAPLVWLSPLLAAWLYQTVSFALLGGTVGDRVCGIVWLTKHGKRPGWFRQLWRAALFVPSFLFFGAGYFVFLLNRTGRPFYDVFVGIHPFVASSIEWAPAVVDSAATDAVGADANGGEPGSEPEDASAGHNQSAQAESPRAENSEGPSLLGDEIESQETLPSHSTL